MADKALGIIETIGLVPAIEAADTGLKTADVVLDGMEKVGAGLVAIILRGDVSSVKAAVEAGSLAAKRLGQVVATTVIARTADGIESILPTGSKASHLSPSPEPPPVTTPGPATPAVAIPRAGLPDIAELEEMSVVKLRAYVRALEHYPMTKEEIRSARKQDLLSKIAEYYRERGLRHD